MDVVPFFLSAFVAAQAVIEEVLLPFDLVIPGKPLFPRSDDFCHFLVPRRADEQVEMVRHEQEDFAVPALVVLVMARGLEDRGADLWMAEMVQAAFLRVEGDEENGPGIDPVGECVVEAAAHDEILGA